MRKHRYKETAPPSGEIRPRSVAKIKKDIAHWSKRSAACPHCPYGCWCDGDWSPEARLESLREELAGAEHRAVHRNPIWACPRCPHERTLD